MLKPESAIEDLPQARGRVLPALHRLGVKTIQDLLFHFPSRYENYSNLKPIAHTAPGETVTIAGRVTAIAARRSFRRRMALVEATIEDESGHIKAIWFNQPFIAQNIRIGNRVRLSGKIAEGKYGTVISNPAYERLQTTNEKQETRQIHTLGLVPVYPETRGITSRWIRFLIDAALPFCRSLKEWLPNETLQRHALPGLHEALHSIHFPDSIRSAEIAERRFAFENLLLLQLRALTERSRLKQCRAPEVTLDIPLLKHAVASLPFALTNAQRRSVWEIANDLTRASPMNRLLNGDVGSGKTVVAALVALLVTRSGYRTAFMAPTEILATQHHETLSRLLTPFGVSVALRTASKKTASEETDIIIGTHALIQKHVAFEKLGLVIIDEQHRFGVSQRAALAQNPNKDDPNTRYVPHFLSMTATPIPRTLALTVYGNLDLSILDEMPESRKKILTRIVPPGKRSEAYDFIRKEVHAGRQVFVLCPKIEQQDAGRNPHLEKRTLLFNDAKAVTEEYQKLTKEVFPDLRVAMLHGKMKQKEKDAVMRRFKNRASDILVATSVIEVGVDVPNASVMMIEGAECFGLAQLHQFRGRVGRGSAQSYCFLLPTDDGMISRRLKAVVDAKNGFELAEQDLNIRGPGELFGTRQWGLPAAALKALADAKLVRAIRDEAVALVREDPTLSRWPSLRNRLTEMERVVHEE